MSFLKPDPVPKMEPIPLTPSPVTAAQVVQGNDEVARTRQRRALTAAVNADTSILSGGMSGQGGQSGGTGKRLLGQ